MKIAPFKGFLLRWINCVRDRHGFGFPIGTGNLQEIIEILDSEANRQGNELNLYGVSEAHKAQLETLFPQKFEFSCSPDESDYIYARSDLQKLSGRKYHKIRNHLSHFHRQFPEAEFKILNANTIADAAEIGKLWYAGHAENVEGKRALMQKYERFAFEDALESFEALNLRGMILYCGGRPAAVSIAGAINNEICSLHFEKAIKPYADFGAFAAVRHSLIEMLDDFQWINLEEDLGLPGLRQAKQAWQPLALFPKYTAVKKR